PTAERQGRDKKLPRHLLYPGRRALVSKCRIKRIDLGVIQFGKPNRADAWLDMKSDQFAVSVVRCRAQARLGVFQVTIEEIAQRELAAVFLQTLARIGVQILELVE